MRTRILSLLLFLCLSVSLSAQVIATTEDGKKVVLKSDGTWMSLEDYTKSLSGGQPATTKGKKRGEKEKATAPAPVKVITMDDFACGEIIGTKTNRQTQEEEKSLSEELLLSEAGAATEVKTLLSVNSAKTYLWDMMIKGQQGCQKETPLVTVTFKDGKSIKLKVANDFLCDNRISLFLSKGLGNKNDLKALKTKPMSKITVKTTLGDVEEDLDDRQAAILQKAFNCLGGK